MTSYTLDYVETMWAHFSNMIFEKGPTADANRMAFWKERLEYYTGKHEQLVPFHTIAANLPLTPKTEP